MKRVTASDARKNWFRLLDEVAGGAVVAIDRGGVRIVLRREETSGDATIPDYTDLVRGRDLDRADEWGWSWDEPNRDLRTVSADSEESASG